MSVPLSNTGNKEGFVLLVEDNADDEELAVMALKNAGLRLPIEVARDGAEAINRLIGNGSGTPPARPLVVFLDLKLPKVDGFGVLKRIRETERLRRLPVVIFTSSDTDDDIARGYELGVNSYVRKPVAFEAFTSAVGLLGQYWLTLNEFPRDDS
jgi:two-component system response regulator